MQERFRWTTIAHRDRALLGPVGDRACDAMLAAAGLAAAATPADVLDIGCGKGEWLVRALVGTPEARGTGIDPNHAFVADAARRAEAAGVAGRVTLVTSAFEPALVADRAFALAICTGASHAFGTYEQALRGLRRLVGDGGAAIVGTGFWRRTPDPGYLAAFGGSEDEMTALEETAALAEANGWRVSARHVSTLEEWDDYEHGYAARVREWVAAHPEDPDAPLFARRIESWAGAYERWGRDTMGFVTFVLVRD
ncbi:MAG: class I SAM-dependent methyltransferase [Candidatus Eisenbacteria bacterium]|uniref:Class I SAM-dependent methyltransferase n=1 Tax=Eiseniibacteriota bacterium TaxID=2212470 RepID=A0A933W7C0_UNCEI|nr:class I SAM-dependent methyltransferase [Candidatus Eisenbacteria bacterium]